MRFPAPQIGNIVIQVSKPTALSLRTNRIHAFKILRRHVHKGPFASSSQCRHCLSQSSAMGVEEWSHIDFSSSEALPNFWTYPAWFTPGSLTLQANPNEKDTASPVPYSLVLFWIPPHQCPHDPHGLSKGPFSFLDFQPWNDLCQDGRADRRFQLQLGSLPLCPPCYSWLTHH